MADNTERVIAIVAEQLGVDKEKVKPETSFVNDLGADSLDTVEFVMELEEEFNVNIPDDAAEKIETVGQAICVHQRSARRLNLRSNAGYGYGCTLPVHRFRRPGPKSRRRTGVPPSQTCIHDW